MSFYLETMVNELEKIEIKMEELFTQFAGVESEVLAEHSISAEELKELVYGHGSHEDRVRIAREICDLQADVDDWELAIQKENDRIYG